VPDNGQAVASLILGAGGLFLLLTSFGMFVFLSLPASILAWVFGVKGRNRVDRGETPKHRGLAQAGIVTGIVGVVGAVLAVALWIALIATGIALEETDLLAR
jgi:threonine/homoserine/homoserine lactone efflux protein